MRKHRSKSLEKLIQLHARLRSMTHIKAIEFQIVLWMRDIRLLLKRNHLSNHSFCQQDQQLFYRRERGVSASLAIAAMNFGIFIGKPESHRCWNLAYRFSMLHSSSWFQWNLWLNIPEPSAKENTKMLFKWRDFCAACVCCWTSKVTWVNKFLRCSPSLRIETLWTEEFHKFSAFLMLLVLVHIV